MVTILRSYLQKPPFDVRMVEVLSQTRKVLLANLVVQLTVYITRTTLPTGL